MRRLVAHLLDLGHRRIADEERYQLLGRDGVVLPVGRDDADARQRSDGRGDGRARRVAERIAHREAREFRVAPDVERTPIEFGGVPAEWIAAATARTVR